MEIIIATLGVLFGGGSAFAYQKVKTANAKNNSDKIIAEARKKSAEILERANEKALKITEKANEYDSERRKEIRKTENRLTEREESLDRKFDQIDLRTEKLRNNELEVEKLKNEIKEIRKKQEEKLEKIAKLSKKEAAEKIMKATDKNIAQDVVNLVAKLQKNATEDAEERAQAILVSAMERISSAFLSGRRPPTTPPMMMKRSAPTAVPKGISGLTSISVPIEAVICATTDMIPTPRRSPRSPARRLSMPLSRRMSRMMSLRWAPSARRMPISRVRSLTETSMILLMPMMPERSVPIPMNQTKTLTPHSMEFWAVKISERLNSPMALSSSGAMSWVERM